MSSISRGSGSAEGAGRPLGTRTSRPRRPLAAIGSIGVLAILLAWTLDRLAAQPATALPPRAVAIVRLLYDRHPALSTGTEDQRRALAKLIAEQVRFEFGSAWGWKRADPGRPPSKDAIAQQQPDGRLWAWDLFLGTTGAPHPTPIWIDITGQVFIPVDPVDHLATGGGSGGGAPPVPPTPPPSSVDLGPILQRLAELEVRLAEAEGTVRTVRTVQATQAAALVRLDEAVALLLARPLFTNCRARLAGIPISCALAP